jgi:hypothetical protein
MYVQNMWRTRPRLAEAGDEAGGRPALDLGLLEGLAYGAQLTRSAVADPKVRPTRPQRGPTASSTRCPR